MLAKSLLPLVLGVANVAAHPVDAPTKTIWTSSTTSTLPTAGIEYIIPNKTSQAVEYVLPKDDQPTTVAPTPETTATDAAAASSEYGDGPRTKDQHDVLSIFKPTEDFLEDLAEKFRRYNFTVEEDPLERRCREDPIGFMEEIEFVYSKFWQQCRSVSLTLEERNTNRLNRRHGRIPEHARQAPLLLRLGIRQMYQVPRQAFWSQLRPIMPAPVSQSIQGCCDSCHRTPC